MAIQTKKWYQSNTVQIAIIQAILGLLAVATTANPTLESVGYIALIKSILDFLLRTKTDTKIV